MPPFPDLILDTKPYPFWPPTGGHHLNPGLQVLIKPFALEALASASEVVRTALRLLDRDESTLLSRPRGTADGAEAIPHAR